MATELDTSQFLNFLIKKDFKSAEELTTHVLEELNHLPSEPSIAAVAKRIKALVNAVHEGNIESQLGKFREILRDFNSKLKARLASAIEERREVKELSEVKSVIHQERTNGKTSKPPTKASNRTPINTPFSNTTQHPASGKGKMTGSTTTQQSANAERIEEVKSTSQQKHTIGKTSKLSTKAPDRTPVNTSFSNTTQHPASGKGNMTGSTTTQQSANAERIEEVKSTSQQKRTIGKTSKLSTKEPNRTLITSHASNTTQHPVSSMSSKKKITAQQKGIANRVRGGNSASTLGRQYKPASPPKVRSRQEASRNVAQASVKSMSLANNSAKVTPKSQSENHGSFTVTDSSFSSPQQQPSEIRESRLKESKYVSHALSYNNPNIADLSDPNRPTKLAEKYSELYDNEWTEAFEAMLKLKNKVSETDITCLLLEIVEKAYKFCMEEADKLRSGILKEIQQEKPGKSELSLEELAKMVELKKKKAKTSVSDLQKKFCGNKLLRICSTRNLKPPSEDGATARYTKRAVELTWWMCIQDPPVHMVTSDTTFDPRLYKAYTKSGSKPDYFVWPPLKLYKEGDVLTKGVVQYM